LSTGLREGSHNLIDQFSFLRELKVHYNHEKVKLESFGVWVVK